MNSAQPTRERTADAATWPILAGMYPDPSICRVGEDYYLANSSFEYTPAVPIWHSTDLVAWNPVGNALTREEQFPAGRSPASRGVYAPTLRFHDGRFWLITTNIDDPRGGHQLYWAADPAGPWSAPIHITELDGIDPDLAWDEDGTCLVTYCSWSDEEAGLRQAAVDLEQGRILEAPRWVWHGTGLGNPEGPHLYRRGDRWYLVIAEGGTERGHVVSVARSHSPRGPFESCPGNPVFTHRSTRHPVQNTGHADLVERPDGTWAAVYLGVRPRGGTPRYHVNGRETFLADIDWIDDWPRLAPAAAPIPVADRSFRDDFDTPSLHPRWVSPGARLDRITRTAPGGLDVEPASSRSGEPSGPFTRVCADAWEADFTVEPGDGACTAVLRLDDRHWYGLRVTGGTVEAVARIGQTESVLASRPAPATPITLRIRSTEATWKGPDDIELGIGDGTDTDVLARLDGRYVSTEVAGGFTGRLIGLWTEAGRTRIRHVRYTEHHPD